jgi:hypothetical protein
LVEDKPLVAARLRAVQEQNGHAERSQLLHLVSHQRDQGRDHERQPAKHQGGQLKAQTFARAGGHDADEVVAGNDVFDNVALVWPKPRQPKDAVQQVVDGQQLHGFGHL